MNIFDRPTIKELLDAIIDSLDEEINSENLKNDNEITRIDREKNIVEEMCKEIDEEIENEKKKEVERQEKKKKRKKRNKKMKKIG